MEELTADEDIDVVKEEADVLKILERIGVSPKTLEELHLKLEQASDETRHEPQNVAIKHKKKETRSGFRDVKDWAKLTKLIKIKLLKPVLWIVKNQYDDLSDYQDEFRLNGDSIVIVSNKGTSAIDLNACFYLVQGETVVQLRETELNFSVPANSTKEVYVSFRSGPLVPDDNTVHPLLMRVVEKGNNTGMWLKTFNTVQTF
ncbi:hypothetical protein GEMRC1_013859 [Eukaryota sp. GEM-RC1]